MDYKARNRDLCTPERSERGYDPFLQKFIQPDTVVANPYSSQSWNRYVYVNNNPVNLTDPSGTRTCDEELGCSGKLQLPKQFTFPSRNDIFNNPIQIPNFLLTQPSLENGDDLVIVGYKKVVNWGKVDWLDIGISAAGIAGDVATATGLPGIIGWGVTEVIEFTEISSNIYDLSGVFTNNYFDSASLVSQNIITQMIKPENRKITTRFGSLVPWVGTIFDFINIGWNISLATERIPLQKRNKFKLVHLITKSLN